MESLIVVVILLAILIPVIRYVYKEKKRGVKCIGCPYAGQCSKGGAACGGEADHTASLSSHSAPKTH